MRKQAKGISRRKALQHMAAGGAVISAGAVPLPAMADTAAKPADPLDFEVPEEGVERYTGEKVVVDYEGKRCIHTRVCVLRQPGVFKPNVKGPWIDPDAAHPEAVSDVALNCASGAITTNRLDGGLQETAPVVNLVHVRENGPLAVHADLVVAGKPDGFRATLCRCGASANKPYCDNAHKKVGFAATGEPPTVTSQPLASRNGKLAVTPMRDGPYVVSGSMEIVSGTGRTIDRLTDAMLCRCGASANKPYCDGSHEQIGFKADGEPV